jgi:transposase-like protein
MKCPVCGGEAHWDGSTHNDEVYRCGTCNKIFFDKYREK